MGQKSRNRGEKYGTKHRKNKIDGRRYKEITMAKMEARTKMVAHFTQHLMRYVAARPFRIGTSIAVKPLFVGCILLLV